jgi:hypothetical protein
MGLANDMWRCLDGQCPKQAECLRFIDRPIGEKVTRMGSPREGDDCRAFFQASREEMEHWKNKEDEDG